MALATVSRTSCTTADADFTREVRRFLSRELTPDLRQAGRDTIGTHSDIGACRIWHRRLFERGWIAPAWPIEWGGTGWTPAQRMIFERECAEADAPILFAGGLRTLGPLLIEMGTPAQRQRFIPPILSGADLWCQGFSEAGAGSDLAALQTRARRIGDQYIVNGAKLWTTGAHLANRMFCLVRTSAGERRQDGITFLLIDMASNGLSVRPIISIAGEHEFNEVTFDDVRVPLANRIGDENDGWSVANVLMRLARSNNTTSGLLRRALRRAVKSAQDHSGDDSHRMKLAVLECELRALESLELSLISSWQANSVTPLQSSMMKTLASELHQRIVTATLDIVGPEALRPRPDAASPADGFAARRYLATRAASIYSGTSETHRNLIWRNLWRE